METFLEYRERIRSIITEQPQIDNSLTPGVMAFNGGPIKRFIHNNHHNSTNIGGDYYHLKYNDNSNIYYRHHNGELKEISFINKSNTQSGVDKNDGDSSHIHNFMKHHIDTVGRLASDSSNTNGSKNLWINFIKKNPDIKFSHVNLTRPGTSTELTSDNIDIMKDKIWGTDSSHKNDRITAQNR